MKHAIRTLFQFDMPYRQFELKETEPKGTPSFFAYKKEKRAKIARIEGTLDARLAANKKRLLALFCGPKNTDLILQPFCIGTCVRAIAASLNGMADAKRIGNAILRPCHFADPDALCTRDRIGYLLENVLTMSETARADDWQTVVSAITEGQTVVLIDGGRRCSRV